MNILIIEDEKLAADKLAKMILRHNPQHQIVGKIRSVEDAVEWLSDQPAPDLVFMDIHLLDGTCFDILKHVNITSPVIFTTAFDAYALEAFTMNSVDYLLKPISFSKLEGAFQKLESMSRELQVIQQEQKLEKLLNLMEDQQQTYKTRFLIKSGSRLIPVVTEEIAYFFSEDRITYLCIRDNKQYSVNYTLDQMEEMLDPRRFFRINRQMIVHIDSVQLAHRYFKGRLKIDLQPPFEGEVLVSSRRVADFQAWLDR